MYARLNKLGTGLDLMRFYHDNGEIRHGEDMRNVGIEFQKKVICGKFLDEEGPTFTEMMDEQYKKTLGNKYVPMPPEGGMIHG